jgi:hypothetical protein
VGTARLFSKILHKEIDVYAAWIPVTNTFGLGDYGVISDGVFVKMGNIGEYGVTFRKAAGEPSRLKFRSDGTTVRRFVGGAEAPVLPQADLDAKLTVEFDAADSFYLDAHLSVESIENLAQVGQALRTAPGWRRQYRVIFAVYTGRNCTILSSRSAKSKIEISGKASALAQFELGNVEAGLTVSAEDSVGLDVVGKTGVVGLRLFKLRSVGPGGPVRILDSGEGDESLVEDAANELPDDI